jgi:TonB family protein
MKNLLLILFLLLALNINAQWVNKTVNNDFDDPYRICYTAPNNGVILKLENVEGLISFYLSGGYYCDESPVVDLSFIVNGVAKKYSRECSISSDNKIVWLINDLLIEEMLTDFKNCNILKVRVNDYTCSSEIYSFNMSGSSSAINFISYNKKVVKPVVKETVISEKENTEEEALTIVDNVNFGEEEIIEFPDVEAEFIGGAQEMMIYINQNIQYPITSIEMNEQGKVYLSFVVEPDGTISNVAIERGVSIDIDNEAKRVVRSMPKWSPGESKGKKARTRCRLPINFQLG